MGIIHIGTMGVKTLESLGIVGILPMMEIVDVLAAIKVSALIKEQEDSCDLMLLACDHIAMHDDIEGEVVEEELSGIPQGEEPIGECSGKEASLPTKTRKTRKK